MQESRPTPSRRAASPRSPPQSPTTSSWPRRSSCPPPPPPPGPPRDSRGREGTDGRTDDAHVCNKRGTKLGTRPIEQNRNWKGEKCSLVGRTAHDQEQKGVIERLLPFFPRHNVSLSHRRSSNSCMKSRASERAGEKKDLNPPSFLPPIQGCLGGANEA